MEYDCADCLSRFSIKVTDYELRFGLESTHSEKCPTCGQKAGWGYVNCQQCEKKFAVELLHWHVHCTLVCDTCPQCGKEYVSACTC